MQLKLSPPTTEARDRAIAPHIIAAAASWPLFVDLDNAPHAPRLAGVFMRCARCDQAVLRLAQGHPEPGEPIHILRSAQELVDGTLAHVLQVHRLAVDPEWSGT
jgi:hypothetical protein